MSYIGNEPEVNAFTITVDSFNGTGACTEFTLTRDIDDPRVIEVVVNGVVQTPTTSYTVTNGLMTFDEAPSAGTNNITVRYLAPVAITYNQVVASQILAGAVTETKLATSAVTPTKIADGAVLGGKIPANAIRGNNIVAATITGNLIATGQITGNLIANNTITGNAIVTPPDIFDDAFLFGGM
jgi:hypothetical protein